MTIKVIGAGFGRTGTLSMKYALEILGFDKCYHMMEMTMHPNHARYWLDLAAGKDIDWEALFDGYQAAVDWPSASFWRDQMVAYPDAKVLLTQRNSDKWYQSVTDTIWQVSSGNKASADPIAQASAQLAFALIWDPIFDGRVDDKAHAIACYEAHNQAVIETVPDDKLLVYEPGQGWEPLCGFFGLPIPDAPYPHMNSTEEFSERWQRIDEEARKKAEE